MLQVVDDAEREAYCPRPKHGPQCVPHAVPKVVNPHLPFKVIPAHGILLNVKRDRAVTPRDNAVVCTQVNGLSLKRVDMRVEVGSCALGCQVGGVVAGFVEVVESLYLTVVAHQNELTHIHLHKIERPLPDGTAPCDATQTQNAAQQFLNPSPPPRTNLPGVV